MNIPKPFVKKEPKRKHSALKGSSTSIKDEKKSCINMSELLQFEAARERALAQVDPSIYENPFSDFIPHRVFINHIDTFNGSHIAEHISNIRKYAKEEHGEGGEDEEESKHEKISELEDFVEGGLETHSSEFQMEKESENYEIIGSLEFYNNTEYRRPEGILELLDNEKKNEFLEKLLTCGFIIYDITSDLFCHPRQIEEAKWVLESIVKRLEIIEKKQPKEFAKYTHCRVFILISTLMTWVKTKPIDPDDPSLPFTERDFRKRKPHPNYKIHCEFEKKVIELGKRYPKNLKTIVIGTGVTYGYEEDILHFFFKMAWQGAPFLPIFKPGKNIIQVIHIDSLASIIEIILENFPKKYKYIIATDPHSITLKEIAKLLAKNLGSGRTKMVDKEEAFLYPDINQRNYDMLSSSINITPGCILDNMVVRWGTELPFAENIPELISQFKMARELLPIKIFIHGPPASGKTFLAKRLSVYYDIPHLTEKGLIEDTINTLKEKIQEKTKPEEENTEKEKIEIEGDEKEEEDEETDEEEEEEEGEDLETLKQNLREIEENLEKNGNNNLDEELLLRLFLEKLSSNLCKNKGYVIDGYPETMEQTKILYAPVEGEEGNQTEDEEEGQGGDISRLCNLNILPGYVESLDASDEFLINRIIRLPHMNVTAFEEHEMCRRLTEFRALNTEDNTPLIFYDEMEVHPMIYNMENDPDIQMKPTFNAIVNHVGPPRNYEKNIPAIESIFNWDEDKTRQAEKMRAEKEEMRKAAEERRQNHEKWMLLKNQELEMEEKALLIMGMPLRHYLMKYVFPCLTRGLVEVARLRPDDPVDFLSEFLFRENPEGKMFQPDYDEREEKLAHAIREYESMMAARRTSRKGSSMKSFSTEKSPRSDAVSRVTNYKCSFVSSQTKSKSDSKHSTVSEKSSASSKSESGVCTCQKSPSLSTCSSDRTPSTASSCMCAVPEPCEPCVPCEEEKKEVDPCKCPCDV